MKIIRGRASGAASEHWSGTVTGDVWANPVLPSTDGVRINNVFFTPGARTNWHSHEQGQVLHVTAGSGYVCTEGDEPQKLEAGDTVWTPAGELHWHGGTSDSFLMHTAVSLGLTDWQDPVTDEQYPEG